MNAYLEMKYFLKTDDKFVNFRKQLAKRLINNSYTNDKACVSPGYFRKRQLSNILDTEPTHATEYNEKMGVHRK